ncbi:hypothetical protein RIF29_15031 [Crotalaria pallida]|uniref:Uncharacterized protein n=1 Tax=Crotalaria pallida TaxID=3830 RepID=A0AAN9FL62_CROPI
MRFSLVYYFLFWSFTIIKDYHVDQVHLIESTIGQAEGALPVSCVHQRALGLIETLNGKVHVALLSVKGKRDNSKSKSWLSILQISEDGDDHF